MGTTPQSPVDPSRGFQHPSLELPVTDPQRDRTVDYLQTAYADGRLSAEEFDQRLGMALAARTRRELNATFAGLARVPLPSAALGVHPVYQPMFNHGSDGSTGRALAVLAHWTPFMSSFFGPALCYAIASKGSFAAREAAKAFNFQVTALIGLIGLGIVTSIMGLDDFVMPLYVIGWFVLTLVGGLHASKGEDWRNPVSRVVPIRLLDEHPQRRLR